MLLKWAQLYFAETGISFLEVVGMAIRKTLTKDVSDALVVSQKAELDFNRTQLEVHTLAARPRY
jgi:uncharacterized protein YqfA (UPF0365 family)